MIRQLDDHMMVCGQVAPHEVAGLAEQGDYGAGQQSARRRGNGPAASGDIEDAAAKAGIAYHYVPIMRGIGPADIESMQQAVRDAEGGKLLAFCRSGTRSALTLALAKREEGARAEEVTRLLTDAGFDPAPIAHLL